MKIRSCNCSLEAASFSGKQVDSIVISIASALMRYLISHTQEKHRKGLILTCKEHLLSFYAQFGEAASFSGKQVDSIVIMALRSFFWTERI